MCTRADLTLYYYGYLVTSRIDNCPTARVKNEKVGTTCTADFDDHRDGSE